MGLILAFCAAWLIFFREEYRFPRALLLIPAGATGRLCPERHPHRRSGTHRQRRTSRHRGIRLPLASRMDQLQCRRLRARLRQPPQPLAQRRRRSSGRLAPGPLPTVNPTASLSRAVSGGSRGGDDFPRQLRTLRDLVRAAAARGRRGARLVLAAAARVRTGASPGGPARRAWRSSALWLGASHFLLPAQSMPAALGRDVRFRAARCGSQAASPPPYSWCRSPRSWLIAAICCAGWWRRISNRFPSRPSAGSRCSSPPLAYGILNGAALARRHSRRDRVRAAAGPHAAHGRGSRCTHLANALLCAAVLFWHQWQLW